MNQSRNLAARAGRWSAQHRKTAILGWILFVVFATVVGNALLLSAASVSVAGPIPVPKSTMFSPGDTGPFT